MESKNAFEREIHFLGVRQQNNARIGTGTDKHTQVSLSPYSFALTNSLTQKQNPINLMENNSKAN